MYRITSLLLLTLLACSDRPPTTPETRPVENPNAGNTALYDVDPEDPYEIGDRSFLDMQPGDAIADYPNLLRDSTLTTGDGTFTVYAIHGRNGEALGYLHPDPEDAGRIGHLVVTSADVVTEQGLRVGNSYAELVERMGEVEVHGSEPASRVYANQGPLYFLLNVANNQYDLDPSTIDPTVVISQIEIR